jgi:hypothetical protein
LLLFYLPGFNNIPLKYFIWNPRTFWAESALPPPDGYRTGMAVVLNPVIRINHFIVDINFNRRYNYGKSGAEDKAIKKYGCKELSEFTHKKEKMN